ncbi:hypothetical protein ACEN9J_12040 [Variovorax sp. Varisp41]|uniref:hypothetical protein n=1 Tax=unclassified Variovorax TaxID=663243 RepID=UPI0039B3B1A0|eukprot:TRINITY_DN430_c0_g3_i1.p1 TRINITY_DN430_c0_g3~~TRINITY_DN430_c0_g3_i1.p1  ORF type:complete len:126 (+),score=14.30 TRINITY_DN430_c0_g3_i1:800-1177(+)
MVQPTASAAFGSHCAKTFASDIDLPFLVRARRQVIAVKAVFRCIPRNELNQWMVGPSGSYRTDVDMLTEVLLEVIDLQGLTGRTSRSMLNDAICDERAAAMLVAVFLKQCQSTSDRPLEILEAVS